MRIINKGTLTAAVFGMAFCAIGVVALDQPSNLQTSHIWGGDIQEPEPIEILCSPFTPAVKNCLVAAKADACTGTNWPGCDGRDCGYNCPNVGATYKEPGGPPYVYYRYEHRPNTPLCPVVPKRKCQKKFLGIACECVNDGSWHCIPNGTKDYTAKQGCI